MKKLLVLTLLIFSVGSFAEVIKLQCGKNIKVTLDNARRSLSISVYKLQKKRWKLWAESANVRSHHYYEQYKGISRGPQNKGSLMVENNFGEWELTTSDDGILGCVRINKK